MMQSLLAGVASAKNNDLKAHKENEQANKNADALQKFKFAEDQQHPSKPSPQKLEQATAIADKKTASEDSLISSDNPLGDEALNSVQILSADQVLSSAQALSSEPSLSAEGTFATDTKMKPSEAEIEISTAPILTSLQKNDGATILQDVPSNREVTTSAEGLNNFTPNIENKPVQELIAKNISDSINDAVNQSDEIEQQQLLSAIQTAQQANTNVKNGAGELADGSISPFNLSKAAAHINVTKQITGENGEEVGALELSTDNLASDSAAIMVPITTTSAEKTTVDIDKNNVKIIQETAVQSLLNSNENTNGTSKEKALASVDNQVQLSASSTTNIKMPVSLEHDPDLSENEASLLQTKTLDQNDTPVLKTEKSDAIAAVFDVNGAKPNQTSFAQSDKLIVANQQQQATNNLLQQPLDLHSKQAAAMIGERVMMMISQGKQEVQIRLDPAELGSMFIKVQVQQDQVQLNIQTQAGLSKDIIEQNMPRLREQLAQQGIQLGEANVQQQSQQQGQQQRNNEVNTASGQRGNGLEMIEDEQTAVWMPSKIASSEQGIDFYA
tara:strand:- start:1300 stop:2970 length:1671 start_codon:yes stop_codon:yes gene_type:complete